MSMNKRKQTPILKIPIKNVFQDLTSQNCLKSFFLFPQRNDSTIHRIEISLKTF